MNFVYIRRRGKRVQAQNLGNGLLRPIAANGHDIVAAAREQEIAETLRRAVQMSEIEFDAGYFCAEPEQPITVVGRYDSVPPQWGGNGAYLDFANADGEYGPRGWYNRKYYRKGSGNSWKTHRKDQYRRLAKFNACW